MVFIKKKSNIYKKTVDILNLYFIGMVYCDEETNKLNNIFEIMKTTPSTDS